MSGQAKVLSMLRKMQQRKSSFRKIRIGSLGDGGYVVPDDLAGISHVISIGIGQEVSFDLHFARLNIPVYQYDPTVSGPPIAHPSFNFNRLAWSEADSEQSVTLTSMLNKHSLTETNDVILKFDVEGAEWGAINATSVETLKHFRLIVCELHGLQGLANAPFLERATEFLTLLTVYHTVVHVHANNCCGMSLVDGIPVPAVMELTLLRNDRSEFLPCTDPIPGPLDYPNMTDRPDLMLNAFGCSGRQ
jgi:hypothetical protein